MLIIDSHADTLECAYDEKISIDNKNLMFNLKDANKYKPYIQFISVFIDTKYINNNVNKGYIRGNNMLDYFEYQYLKYKEEYNLLNIKSKEDLDDVINNNKIGIILSSENGGIIGYDIKNISKLYNRGIRVMGLTWNDDNLLGSGAYTKNDVGITTFGKNCIEKMNDLDIIIDVSHLSYNSFFDTIDNTKYVIASHSNVYNLCNTPRNLYDNQIKSIAKKDGVIGICLYSKFLKEKEEVELDDVIKHIAYIADLVGVEYVGIGTDFDGIDKSFLPKEINGVEDMDKIIFKLEEYGFAKNEIKKIMGDNYLRILSKI